MTFLHQGNLFANLPTLVDREVFEDLLACPNFRVERIISTGQATPPGVWCDEDWAEWVVVLRGAADVLIEGETQVRHLLPGDYLTLPAHCRHRVAWTDPDQPTLWLAIHFPAEPEAQVANGPS